MTAQKRNTAPRGTALSLSLSLSKEIDTFHGMGGVTGESMRGRLWIRCCRTEGRKEREREREKGSEVYGIFA